MKQTKPNQRIASATKTAALSKYDGNTSSNVALAAGMVAEIIKSDEDTNSVQPAKKPSELLKIKLTQAYAAPALASM